MAHVEACGPLFAAAGLTVLERGWLSSNNILFAERGGDAATLVDSGYWSHQDQTVALVARALGARRLERLLNTHLHADHCGGNAALYRVFGCRIEIPAGERGKVDAWDESRLPYRDTGQHCPRFACDGVLAPESSVQLAGRAWRVIASPGHDPESVVLYEPELRILISADALWENGFGVVFPEIEGRDAFASVGATLERIARLAIDWVIPGHGAPFSDVAGAVDRARLRLDGFKADPRRHAHHAAKVLLKFHLLEVQAQRLDELSEWIDSTRYFALVHAAHFPRIAFEKWRYQILDELCRSCAARVDDPFVHNA